MTPTSSFILNYFANSIWQAPLIFVAALVITRLAHRTEPNVQHRIWVGTLVAQVCLPAVAVTPIDMFASLKVLLANFFQGDASRLAGVNVMAGASEVHGDLGLPIPMLSMILGLYACVTLSFLARLFYSLDRTLSLLRNAKPVQLSGSAASRYGTLQKVFGLRETRLTESSRLRGPSTIGIVRHVMVVPQGFVTNSLDEDLDAAFAHEFAHMARHDFAKNLVYELICIPLTYHPVMWLTRARMRESREMVCDAMAAAAVDGQQKYARSLLRLAAGCLTGPAKTSHAIGIFDGLSFERRIVTLTNQRPSMKASQRFALTFASALIALFAGGSALAMRVSVSGNSAGSPPQSAASGDAARISGGVMAGNVLSKVNPTYPPDAKAAGISGSVVLHAIIGKDGTIENLTVISGPKELTASALDAVRQWTYRPYLLNGEPVEVDTTITVNYQLAR